MARKIPFLAIALLVVLITACRDETPDGGGPAGAGASAPRFGAIAVRIIWGDAPATTSLSSALALPDPSYWYLVPAGVGWIRGTVSDPAGAFSPMSVEIGVTAGESGTGTINTVPVGNGYTLRVDALSPDKATVLYTGQTTVSVTGDPNPTPVTVVVNPVTGGSFTVGGTISGNSGNLWLQLNGGNDFLFAINGPFAFSGAPLGNGETYSVTVLTQPTGQTCTVANGSGTIAGANVTNVGVNCAGTPPTALAASATTSD